MAIHKIVARDLPDLWFQAVHDILDVGRKFQIDRGSYAGQTRLEYDYFTGHITYPWNHPLLPDIPSHLNIPNPVDEDYIYGQGPYQKSYLEYLMTPTKAPEESYTYGERLTRAPLTGEKKAWWESARGHELMDKREHGKWIDEEDGQMYINQIEWVIETYKKYGYRNNQMVLQIAEPSDIVLQDPPCLRSIDTRIQDNHLHFFVYFRSWDLWAGLPANLAGIQHLKEYMASEIGVDDGEMIVESKGLHLYGYAEDLAKLRCLKM
ncbi:MAG: thymidylate synthase [Desulfobacterales bacterium]|nr:thymidylate synthase [Desulfobacterales bacterium]